MYADPTQIREKRVTLYLNEQELNLVNAINEYRGGQRAALLRELLIESCHRALVGEVDIQGKQPSMEGAQYGLFTS